MLPRGAPVWVLVLVLAVLAGACAPGETEEEGTPLTPQQQAMLADNLYDALQEEYEASGDEFLMAEGGKYDHESGTWSQGIAYLDSDQEGGRVGELERITQQWVLEMLDSDDALAEKDLTIILTVFSPEPQNFIPEWPHGTDVVWGAQVYNAARKNYHWQADEGMELYRGL